MTSRMRGGDRPPGARRKPADPLPPLTLGPAAPASREVHIDAPAPNGPLPRVYHDTGDHGRAMMTGILGRKRRLTRELDAMAARDQPGVAELLERLAGILPPEAEAMFQAGERDQSGARISDKLVAFHVLAEAHGRLAELEREVARLRSGTQRLDATLGLDTVSNFVADSPRTVFVATDMPLRTGDRVQVGLELKRIGRLDTEARVVWRRPGPDAGVGLELQNLQPRDRAAIALFMQSRDPLPAAAARGALR
ncbi:MAG: PilZ domain-containing protein [Myxococcales bacterium]|nr:PilZ domain-containing protein [Myxococcales bacterium]